MTPHIGDTISYKLRASELPRDPDKLWHGVVELAVGDWYRVRLTDWNYEGIRDIVVGFQITSVKPLDRPIDV
jgi:hypothetical protein